MDAASILFHFLSLALRERAARLHRRPSLGVCVGLNLTARGPSRLNPFASQDFCRSPPPPQLKRYNSTSGSRFPTPLKEKKIRIPGSDGTQCVAGDRILFMNIHRTLGPVPNLLPPRRFRLGANSVDGLCPSDFHAVQRSTAHMGAISGFCTGADTPLSWPRPLATYVAG